MIYQNVLEAMGHTPMIQLNKMPDPEGARVLVKFEGLNVGGSVKTRTAFNIILEEPVRKQGMTSPAGCAAPSVPHGIRSSNW